MKKGFLWVLILCLSLCCFSGCAEDGDTMSKSLQLTAGETSSESVPEATVPPEAQFQVAMITDYGEITDQGYNQAAYEAGHAWCKEYNIPFTYYRPDSDSTEARVSSIELAIREGANVLLLPGYSFGYAIAETAEKYPEVYYIALDVSEWDLPDSEEYVCPKNVFIVNYREEIAGFLAGYAAVNMGYRDLGFIGSMAVPAVLRYGYGFIQGVDYAAGKLGVQASVKHGFGFQCFCDAGIHGIRDHTDKWFKEGTQAVFFCAGYIYTTLAELERPYDLKIIGVDMDMKESLDGILGEGTAITSAMKSFSATVSWALSELILEDQWEKLGGTIQTLGVVSSTDLEKNHVSLPESTQWNDSFTKTDYAAIVDSILTGAVIVDPSIDYAPTVMHTTVDYQGNLEPIDQ